MLSLGSMRGQFLFTFLLLAPLAGGCSSSATGTGTPDAGPTPGPGSTSGTPPVAPSYDALFAAPTTPALTPDSLNGVWAGSGVYAGDLRLKISASSIVIALSCSSQPAVGLELAARITSSGISLLESKNVSVGGCRISAAPLDIPRCIVGSADSSGCYEVKGTVLSFGVDPVFIGANGTDGTFRRSFTKLSD